MTSAGAFALYLLDAPSTWTATSARAAAGLGSCYLANWKLGQLPFWKKRELFRNAFLPFRNGSQNGSGTGGPVG